jgi:hypothetical protein
LTTTNSCYHGILAREIGRFWHCNAQIEPFLVERVSLLQPVSAELLRVEIKRTPRHNPFYRDHASKVAGSQSSWVEVMVPKAAAEPDMIHFALDIMFLGIMSQTYTLGQRMLEGRYILGRILQKATMAAISSLSG